MDELNINALYDAISDLEREANYRRNVGGRNNWERAKDLDHTRQDALKQFQVLSAALPRLRELKQAADREYDRYVTREPEGCSCHINPPCSYCTREIEGAA